MFVTFFCERKNERERQGQNDEIAIPFTQAGVRERQSENDVKGKETCRQRKNVLSFE